MTAFKTARDKDPDNPQPWYNMTICLREQGQHDAAFEELKAMLATFPDHAGGHTTASAVPTMNVRTRLKQRRNIDVRSGPTRTIYPPA